jgi:hypothetical protein
MNGLFDFLKTPQGQGLLAAGLGMAANAGRGGTLNTIGRGGLLGLAGYANAENQQLRAAEEAQQREVRDLQLRQMRDSVSKDEQIRAAAKGAYTPAQPGMGALNAGLPPEMQTPVVPGRAAGFDTKAFLGQVMSIDPIRGMEWQTKLKPETPFGKVDPKDYTSASVQKFAMTGNHADLVPVRKMDVVGNRAVNLYEAQPGQVFDQVDPNQPFAMVGGKIVPNQAFQQFSLNKARAGASNVSVTTKQETEESKTVGKFFGDNYAKVQEAGMNAQGSLNRLGRLGGLLEGVETGKFAPLGVEVAKTAESLGLKIDPKLANKEAAIALSSEIALQLRNPAGGAGMPGAMSDADRNFLAGMVPGIEKTPEGRKTIIETARKLAQRDIEVAKMARDYRKKNGTINEGFYDELARFSAANPLFGAQQAPGAAAGAPKPTLRFNPATGKLEPV